MKVVCILEQDTYKPGDPAPKGYLAWHEWAEAQHKAGLRQKQCGRCGLWRYPQELSDQIDRCEMKSRKGPVTVETVVCLKCAVHNDITQETASAPEMPDETETRLAAAGRLE